MLEHETIVSEDQVRSLTEDAITRTETERKHERKEASVTIRGLAICKVIGVERGLPLLTFEYEGTSHCFRAIAIVGSVDEIEVGKLVCAAFDQNQCDRPLVLGVLSCDVAKNLSLPNGTVISDDDQITIKCGKASINLKSDGTVAIRGTNVASRASQTNRIRGGNVQIN
ncbi:MAG: hypothetical protein ABL921_25590 [Pirellula sp.]